MVVVADGTDLAAQKLERVLTTDPGMGVIRHVDAGYERAIEVARERGVRVPMRDGGVGAGGTDCRAGPAAGRLVRGLCAPARSALPFSIKCSPAIPYGPSERLGRRRHVASDPRILSTVASERR